MNLNNFTIKAQEVVEHSLEIVRQKRQQIIEPAHLMKSIMTEAESIVNFLFQKIGVNTQHFANILEKEIDSYPKVTGGEPHLGREVKAILQTAIDISSKLGDRYVSVEPIVLLY